MEDTLRDFEKRQAALRRKHQKLAGGYVTHVNRNGIIEHRPKPVSQGFTLRFLMGFALVGLIGKGFILAWLGADSYGAHVARLDAGSAAEQVGAFLMQADPVTTQIAALFAMVLG